MLHEKAGERGTWNGGQFQVDQSCLKNRLYTERFSTMRYCTSLSSRPKIVFRHNLFSVALELEQFSNPLEPIKSVSLIFKSCFGSCRIFVLSIYDKNRANLKQIATETIFVELDS